MSTETKERKPITLEMSFLDLMIVMSEGNPGALNVMMNMIKKDSLLGPMKIIALDDMNIRGTQIWVGYKDHCGEDMDKFVECITKRDPEMVEAINNEGLRGNHQEKAVTGGASHPGAREYLK
jgi:hypothetical protein